MREPRTFSRWMPHKTVVRTSIAGWFVLAGLLALLVTWCFANPVLVVSIFGAIILMQIVVSPLHSRRLRRVAEKRIGEDIGTFARSFDRRSKPFDPWVVRATWDALQPYVKFRGGSVPLRPTDRFVEDFGFDAEDQEEVFLEVVERSGRTWNNPEANPYFLRVSTIGDLVAYTTYQPRVGASA